MNKSLMINKDRLQRQTAPYLFILPNFLIFLIFVVIPAIYGLVYSFTDFDGLSELNFIGLKNYIKILNNDEFWEIFGKTSLFAGISVPLIFAISLGIAMLLIKNIRMKGLFRAVFYWPTMISFIIVGVTWKWILGEDLGIVNYILTLLGYEPVRWMSNSFNASLSVILATLWCRIGFYMVMFIAGLQSIPESYYEAAQIDGATKSQVFFKITLPLLKPTSLLVLILSVIDAFKAYPLILALTGGGPGKSTTYIVQYIYEYGFQRSEVGYASAMSVVLFLVVGLLTSIQFKLSKGGRIE